MPEPRAASFLLEAVGVTLAGREVLADVDLAIAAGEAVCVVGPSGAGKTTLLRLLNGTVLPTRGRALTDGVELGKLGRGELRRARARVGFVHQDLALVPNLRVSQNVIAGRLGRRGFLSATRSMVWPAEAELLEVHGLLERVGIPEKLFQRTDTLSGGERQRVAVARALFQGPEALVADEPVASVDPARARDIVALLRRIASEEGLTFVASLHDLDLARELFPRCVGLRGGRVRFDDDPRRISEESWRELYRLGPATGRAGGDALA